MADHSELETSSTRDIETCSNKSTTDSQRPIVIDSTQEDIKLTKRRWAILFAVASFGLFGSLAGETGSILHTVLDLLELKLKKYVLIQQSFSYLPVLTTVPAGWFIDKYGLKVAMQLAVVVMIIRDTFRALLFNPYIPYWKHLKIFYWIMLNIASSQAVTLYYCLPLKVSENWFSDTERTLAWSTMLSSSNIGLSIASFSFPRFIHEVKDVYPLFYLNIACAVATTIIVLLSITKSKPTHPPSERMVVSMSNRMPYFKSIKLALKQRDLLIHLFHEAIFEGIAIAVLVVLQDILTSSGKSNIFVGNLMSILGIASVMMIISLSTFVHRMKNIVLACKVASLMRTALIVPFFLVILWPTPEYLIIIIGLASNLTRSWASPNFTNMTAHLASGVIPEATIAGISVTTTVVLISLSQVIFVQLIETSHDGNHDYTRPMIFAIVVCVIDALFYVIFFKGKTNRRREDTESPTVATRVNPSLNAADCDIET